MNTQSLLLILLVVTVVFGLGVVVLNRRSSGGAGVKPIISEPVVVETPVAQAEVVEAPAVETDVVETEVVVGAKRRCRWLVFLGEYGRVVASPTKHGTISKRRC
jgi:hypothetical protein